MSISSPRLRRLDNALANLPPESDAMLLSELDGFLAGIVVSPEPILPSEWLPVVWGDDEVSLFEDEREAQWYGDLVVAHRDSIIASLGKGAGRYKPFLEVDVRNGEILWELWIEGFAAAMALRPDDWTELADGGPEDVAETVSGLMTLIEIASDGSNLAREVIDGLTEEAPRLIPTWIDLLHGRRPNRGAGPTSVGEPAATKKAGRNDPCPCGSGRKHKKCCGLV